ncbi:hypothetical protein BGZ95_003064, partial [Linnemannia exigua]
MTSRRAGTTATGATTARATTVGGGIRHQLSPIPAQILEAWTEETLISRRATQKEIETLFPKILTLFHSNGHLPKKDWSSKDREALAQCLEIMRLRVGLCRMLDSAWKEFHGDRPFEFQVPEVEEQEQEQEGLKKHTDLVARSIVEEAMARPGNGSYSTCVRGPYQTTPYNSLPRDSTESSHRYNTTGGGGVGQEGSINQREPLVQYHPHPETTMPSDFDRLSRPVEFISSPVEFLIRLRIEEEPQWPYAEVLRYAAQGRRFRELFSQYAFRLGRLLGMFEVEWTFPAWQKAEIFFILKATVGKEVFGQMEAAAQQQQLQQRQDPDNSNGEGRMEPLAEGSCGRFCEVLAFMAGPDDALAQESCGRMMRRQSKRENLGGDGQEASVVEDERPVRYYPFPEKRSNPAYQFIASPFEFLTKLRIQYEREVLGRFRSDSNVNGYKNDDNLPNYDNHAGDYQDDINYAQYIHRAASDHFPTLEQFQTKAMLNRDQSYPHIEHWTWKEYESILVDAAIPTPQKMDEVLQYAQQGRHKHEPYKVYARRLRRLVDMYKVDSSLPVPWISHPIYFALNRSVSCTALDYMRLYWDMIQWDPRKEDNEHGLAELTTCGRFVEMLGYLDGPEDTPEYMKMEAARRRAKKMAGGGVAMPVYNDERPVRYHPSPETMHFADPDFKYIATPIEFLLNLRIQFEQMQLRRANGDNTENDDYYIEYGFSDKDPNDIDTDFDYADYIHKAVIGHPPTLEGYNTRVMLNRRRTYSLVKQWDWKRYEWAFVQEAIPYPNERVDQVIQYARQGRYKHEPYKEYGQRLRRLVDMYAVKEFPLPIQNRIFAILERSVEWETLDLMRVSWRLKQKDPNGEFCEDGQAMRKAAIQKYEQEWNGFTAAATDGSADGHGGDGEGNP